MCLFFFFYFVIRLIEYAVSRPWIYLYLYTYIYYCFKCIIYALNAMPLHNRIKVLFSFYLFIKKKISYIRKYNNNSHNTNNNSTQHQCSYKTERMYI